MLRPTVICCATEASFVACVPKADCRRIVVGLGPAFVFVTATEEVAPGNALHRAVVEHGWLARGFIGITPDGDIAVLHGRAVPDTATMDAAVLHLINAAEERDAVAVQWLERLAALPDTRAEGEVNHA